LTSKYAVGYIEQSFCVLPKNQVHLAAGAVVYGSGTKVQDSLYALASSNVLQPLPGDITKAGDATKMQTNRIFVVNGSQLNINFYVLSISEDHKIPHTAHIQTTIFLRNNADGN